MKRLLFVLIGSLAFASFNFAQDSEIGGTFLFNSSTNTMIGGGLNIGGSSYFNDVVGMAYTGNIMYAPYNGATVIIIDSLIGLSFKVVDNDDFSLPIAVGPYIDYVFAFGESGAARGLNVGVGGSITAKIKTSETLKLYARFQGAYAFLGGGELFLTPCIGLAF
ncbi:MAG: hypothetical protein LBH75_09350 [Treponema sp.]|jgi:hypothetical protein|nr:hypothetical protein [Treponema sp.]